MAATPAPDSVGVPAVHETPLTLPPLIGTGVNVWLYAYVPVALPSVEPNVSVTLTAMFLDPSVASDPAMNDPSTVWPTAPETPKAVPLAGAVATEGVSVAELTNDEDSSMNVNSVPVQSDS
jgi:hypothetical protein